MTMAGYHILLAEDSPADAELAVRALRRARLRNPITVFEDGEVVLQALLGPDGAAPPAEDPARPRLLLLDVHMPRRNGLEVLKELRRHASTRELAVIMVTSSSEAGHQEEALQLGVRAYLPKPVRFESLIEAIGRGGLLRSLLVVAPEQQEPAQGA